MDTGKSSAGFFRPRVVLLASCSGFALAAMCSLPAQAQTSISASSTYSLGGAPSSTLSQSTPTYPSPDIFPNASDSSGNSIFGHVYGDPTGGSFFGTRSSGQGTFSINGTLDFQTTFTNNSGGFINPILSFAIDAGELNVSLPTGAASAFASLNADITESINGGPAIHLFDYASFMDVTDPTANPTFGETGAVFNPSGPTLSAGNGDYSWPAYDGLVPLGLLNAGDSVLIDYKLVSSASGSGTCSPSGGYPGVAAGADGVTGGGSSCDTALARIGDPFTVSGDSPVGIPEPASAALLGAGLAGLAFMRKRRRIG